MIHETVSIPDMTDAEILSAAIKKSGLSVRRFAREVLVRDPRTVWRWLAGDNPLPRTVRELCERAIEETPAKD